MENTNNQQEKRKAERIRKTLIIQFSIETGDPLTRKWDVSSIKDISETGVSFRAAENIPVGAIIHMLIKIPLRPFEWFEVSGKVVSVEAPKVKRETTEYDLPMIRVFFLDLKEEQKKLIHEYVAWCLVKDGGKK
ncbi:MAG: PilZ domain-containing protein [Candidatus Omnitrophota bacterium]|jgi:hypothetical protein